MSLIPSTPCPWAGLPILPPRVWGQSQVQTENSLNFLLSLGPSVKVWVDWMDYLRNITFPSLFPKMVSHNPPCLYNTI